MRVRPGYSVLAIVFLVLLSATVPAGAGPGIKVDLDGWSLESDVEPLIDQGRTLVPFRVLAEALGVEVEWEDETRTVRAWDGDVSLEMPVDSATALANGQLLDLEAPPRIVEGRTLVPLRVFSETFGAGVEWDGEERLVTVESPPRSLDILGFYAIRAFPQRHYIPYLSQVAYGWARVNQWGEPVMDGADFYWPSPAGDVGPQELIAGAQEAGTDPLLMVFAEGENGSLSQLLQDEEARLRAARELTDLAKKRGFRGLLLDFEGLGWTRADDDDARREQIARVREQFNLLVMETAREAREKGLELALALHPPDSTFQGYDYESLGNHADYLVIMAYDYSPRGEPEPPERVRRSLALALDEVDAGQLMLGISLASEEPETLRPLVGLASRHGLRGIALWRLGLVQEGHWEALEGLVTIPEPKAVPDVLVPGDG